MCIYDFYWIFGEDINVVFNFYVLVLLIWLYLIVVFYYVYGVLEWEKGCSWIGVGVLLYLK